MNWIIGSRIWIVGANARCEGGIQRTIVIEPRYATGGNSTNVVKGAANIKFATDPKRGEGSVIVPKRAKLATALIHDNGKEISLHPIRRTKR